MRNQSTVMLMMGLFVGLSLTGCASTTDSSFSCPSPSSGMCSSVTTVDKMVTSGQINTNQSQNLSSNGGSDNNPWANFSTPYPVTVQDNSALRTQDKVMAVWIAPYEDETGNYHDGSNVFAVIEQGHWKTKPVKAIGDES